MVCNLMYQRPIGNWVSGGNGFDDNPAAVVDFGNINLDKGRISTRRSDLIDRCVAAFDVTIGNRDPRSFAREQCCRRPSDSGTATSDQRNLSRKTHEFLLGVTVNSQRSTKGDQQQKKAEI